MNFKIQSLLPSLGKIKVAKLLEDHINRANGKWAAKLNLDVTWVC
jgi:hypothetical protein